MRERKRNRERDRDRENHSHGSFYIHVKFTELEKKKMSTTQSMYVFAMYSARQQTNITIERKTMEAFQRI